MNAKENFQQLLDDIYGNGVIKIEINDDTNNIIGALNSDNNFIEFKKNFKERLIRLKEKFCTGSTERCQHLFDILKEISTPRWGNYTGAYAELAAFDCLQNNLLVNPIQMDVDVPADVTYAKEMGKSVTNVDGYISEFDSFFDIKRLADNCRIVLDDVGKKAKNDSGVQDVHILPEYPIDSDYRDYENKFFPLMKELSNCLSNGGDYLESKISQVSFRICKKGLISAESVYSPERHADNVYHQLFGYANKFIKNKPFFLVMVHFPWYNNLITDFDNMNIEFYRNLSKRFFCQDDSESPMTKIIPAFAGADLVCEVTRKVTGIIYIEDKIIKGESMSQSQTRGYVFLNPYADNKCSIMEDYLQSIAKSGNVGIYEVSKV